VRDPCDKNGCGHLPQAAACSDGNACTSGDQCSQGVCKGGATKPCNDGNPCTVDGCNANSGACTVLANTGEGSECDDGNACTADTCDAAAGCKHQANSTLPCDDGDACTEIDTCDAGVCKGKSKACDDGNPRTLDGCSKGTCTASAPAMDGKTCPPPGACNADGTCGGGTCTAPKANCPVQKGKQIWPVVFPAKLGPAKTIYDPVGVHLVQFTIGEAEWTKFKELVAAKKLTDTYFAAKITFDGEDFCEIGVRPFGYGSMFYNPNKPSIRAKFNAFIEGKKGPDGLRNIRFKNSGQDRTFLRQPLSQLMMQLAGGYAPRFGWARLWVNGEPMGIYQVFEQVDKKFFHANFDNDEGNDYQRKKTCLGFNCSSPTCQEVADNQTGDTGDGSEMAAIAKIVKWSADATWVQEVDKLIDWPRCWLSTRSRRACPTSTRWRRPARTTRPTSAKTTARR
jgi:hypothetical protein